VEVWQASNLRPLRLGEEKKKEEEERRNHRAKYNGLPYSIGRPSLVHPAGSLATPKQWRDDGYFIFPYTWYSQSVVEAYKINNYFQLARECFDNPQFLASCKLWF